MAPDTMRIRLHLRLIRVLEVVIDTVDELVVSVASTRSSSAPWCGFACRAVHDTRAQRVRDLPISGRCTTLVWQRRRFSCANCKERHLEVEHAGMKRFDTAAVPITRYRYRGTAIPPAWALTTITAA